MRIALVHDWVTGLRGGERVLDTLARAHPDAHLHTLIHRPGTTTPAIDALAIHTSPLNGLPGIERHYRKFLPLFPLAIGRLDLRGYDLVLSISHAVARSAPVPPGTPHLAYCLTPMRYVWDHVDAYLGHGAKRWLATPLIGALRRFDRSHSTPDHVDRFVAISRAVASRIRRHYGRDSRVVHPPVAVERFRPSLRPPEDFYLLVGGFVPYKREQLVIDAFRKHGGRLIVVGDGPLRRDIAKRAPANVEFVGRLDDPSLAELFANCRALIYPQEEDFGIVAVEAQASGRPVIAFAAGGALDSVRPLPRSADPDGSGAAGATGILFEDQSVEGLLAAIRVFERHEAAFDPKLIRAHAERFSTERFLHELALEIEATLTRAQ